MGRGRQAREGAKISVVTIWRHARAIVLLPVTVTILVPWLILRGAEGPRWGWLALPGVVLIGFGLWLWIWTVRLLARVGRGTLAPWDPTRRLVVAGPYRYVRNPMITAVVAVLVGEALVFRSGALVAWAAGFFVLNWALFVVYEEPALERRFGDEYRAYKRAVPRWLPRRRATDASSRRPRSDR
jgi:protein-S-isoprenylcysteine O-methyltransferase Ste14